ncbi:two-component system regulatory protein, partial [Xanthomonas arboricola pv. pruni str. MAFF 311562]
GPRRDPAAAGQHRPGTGALPVPRPAAPARDLQRARGGDPAPARRRLFQQGDRPHPVPGRRHGEELRLHHPGKARHPRPHKGGVEGDHVAGDL